MLRKILPIPLIKYESFPQKHNRITNGKSFAQYHVTEKSISSLVHHFVRTQTQKYLLQLNIFSLVVESLQTDRGKGDLQNIFPFGIFSRMQK